MVKVLEFKLAH